MTPTLRSAPAPSSNTPGTTDDQAHYDDVLQLARRLDDRDPRTPPWAWPNLAAEQAELTEVALDGFVEQYNQTFVIALDEIIPGCWRQHPALAVELLVQFWSWWACHPNPKATVHMVDDYYERTLPMFQSRLAKRLLGPGAVNCRKGSHARSADPELARAIQASSTTSSEPDSIYRLRRATFGAGASPNV